MSEKEKDDKLKDTVSNKMKEKWFEIITLLISIVALGVSFSSCTYSREANDISDKALKASERENSPKLRIIQNLWTEEPYFELVNEATAKLDSVPSPSYFIFIPSKLYFDFGDERASIPILSFVDYTAITEQIVQSETKSSIVKSSLPKKFFAKKGEQDIVRGQVLDAEENLEVYIDTLPFLVIVSSLDYEYNAENHHEVLLSTPLVNENLSDEELGYLKDYIYDNASKLRVSLSEDDSIYKTAHKQVEELVSQLYSEDMSPEEKQDTLKIIGGVEGGYGNVLKKIGGLIKTEDPMEERIMEGDKNTSATK